MDFTGSIAREFQSLPSYWWVWLLIAALVIGIVETIRKKPTSQIVLRSLLAAYTVFILFQTVIGRRTGTEFTAKWIPFWSYGNPELTIEIVLNYLLFIPLGMLLYGVYRKKLELKVVFLGVILSVAIEVGQLIFRIGLFEFDDIIGNSIGCLIGALLGMGICMLIEKKKI